MWMQYKEQRKEVKDIHKMLHIDLPEQLKLLNHNSLSSKLKLESCVKVFEANNKVFVTKFKFF